MGYRSLRIGEVKNDLALFHDSAEIIGKRDADLADAGWLSSVLAEARMPRSFHRPGQGEVIRLLNQGHNSPAHPSSRTADYRAYHRNPEG